MTTTVVFNNNDRIVLNPNGEHIPFDVDDRTLHATTDERLKPGRFNPARLVDGDNFARLQIGRILGEESTSITGVMTGSELGLPEHVLFVAHRPNRVEGRTQTSATRREAGIL